MSISGADSIGASLARQIADTAARRVLVGVNWTLVEGPAGCGLAQTPARDGAGCRPLRDAGHYRSRSLRALAGLVGSDNRFEVAIGWAAINAHFNRRELIGSPANGLDLLARTAGVGRTVCIGRFPDLGRYLPDALIVEREPRPGEYAEHAAVELLPGAARVAITASALFDGSADRLIGLARGAHIALIGPSTPLAPMLHDWEIGILAGLVIDDAEVAAQVAMEAGAVRALKRAGRYVALCAGDRPC
ncbi:MAG: hypothetical protein FJX52_12075 [Alphaproteobacteria bacterium]|nr:hypothetical protein [Alphaproteobacteria bacterium]